MECLCLPAGHDYAGSLTVWYRREASHSKQYLGWGQTNDVIRGAGFGSHSISWPEVPWFLPCAAGDRDQPPKQPRRSHGASVRLSKEAQADFPRRQYSTCSTQTLREHPQGPTGNRQQKLCTRLFPGFCPVHFLPWPILICILSL